MSTNGWPDETGAGGRPGPGAPASDTWLPLDPPVSGAAPLSGPDFLPPGWTPVPRPAVQAYPPAVHSQRPEPPAPPMAPGYPQGTPYPMPATARRPGTVVVAAAMVFIVAGFCGLIAVAEVVLAVTIHSDHSGVLYTTSVTSLIVATVITASLCAVGLIGGVEVRAGRRGWRVASIAGLAVVGLVMLAMAAGAGQGLATILIGGAMCGVAVVGVVCLGCGPTARWCAWQDAVRHGAVDPWRPAGTDRVDPPAMASGRQ